AALVGKPDFSAYAIEINGSKLLPEYRQAYANYFVKVIREYEKRGIPVDSLTIQNEPAYASYGVPSMGFKPEEQGEFIRDFLGPTLEKNKINLKIYGHDHNWSQSERDADPIAAVKGVKKYLKGIAYHCYGGEKWGMWDTVNHHPDMEIFQTECSGSDAGYSHLGDFHWWLDTQSVGAVNMGSTGSIAWNLCLDEKHGPVNWGKNYSGCTNCRGLAELNFSEKVPTIKYNPEFHALEQVSKFLVPGSQRIEVAGKTEENFQQTAFLRPDGSIVMVVENLKNEPQKIRAKMPDCRSMVYEVPAQGATTFIIGAPQKAGAAEVADEKAAAEDSSQEPAAE
ncbi:MAG: glycoside hydrolase family 30 protein, partial [Bdellovibrionota bacterium]